MPTFVPSQVYYEPQALEYDLGKTLVGFFREQKIPVRATTSHNQVTGISGRTAAEAYRSAKKTLVIGVKRGGTFQTCKPSAHYQLPLATGCPGMCEYCYLQTTLGRKPYLRIYVNVDEVLLTAQKLIEKRIPEITIFEGAATSDPLPVEKYTGSLKKTIEFFGRQPFGRFRFVTKFTEVESLLDARHRGHTRFRFSLNCEQVIRSFEHGTPSAQDRILAASKVLKAGYPLGFIIAPIMKVENWRQEYQKLFLSLQEVLKPHLPPVLTGDSLTFELITHRFTARAKTNILQVFPQTKLPMEESDRKFKFGQFGYGKYLYQPEEMQELKEFFYDLTGRIFPGSKTEYFV